MIKDELESIAIFQDLGDEKLKECADLLTVTEVLMGERLTKEDDYGYSMILVISGTVAVKVGEDVVAELKAGDHFGEVSLLEHKRRNATVVAREACRVAKVMSWDFEKLLAVDPVIKQRLDAAAAERRSRKTT